MIDQGNLIMSILKKRQILKISSWEVNATEFVNRVKHCRRRRRTFYNLANVYGCDNECSDIHGEEFPRQSEFHYEYFRSHTEEDASSKWIRCIGKKHSWKYLSLIGDETIITLQRAKVYVFSDSVLCLGKILQNPESNDAWEQRLGWIHVAALW